MGKLLTMHPRALRLVAARWFLVGWSLSGRGFHGENHNVSKHKATRSLLLAHFNRIWEGEHKS